DPENPITPPEGYVTVEFTTDANGTLEGTKKFYVNPKADPVVTYEQITAPTIKPATGYKVADKPWDPEFAATDEIKAAATHAAQYVKLDDVIPDPEDPENPITPPEGYVTVEFTTEATKGALEGTKKFYVNPKADPAVTYAQITEPAIVPATGYKVADTKWDPAFAATDEIKAAATHAAQYTKLDDIIPDTTPDTDDDKPEGYVTVTFAPGANGSITTTDPAQVVKYYVNPLANKTLGDITKPEITANPGFTHTGWDTEDTVAITADTPVTATYIAMTAGDKPVIQGPILNTAETVDVVAKPGSTVTVIFPNAVDGEPPIEVTTTTHDEFGKYTVDVPTGAKMEPGQQINATSTEPGNTPVAADPVPVTQLDSRVPSKPVQDKQELTGTIPNVTPETVQTGWELILTDLEGNPLVDGEGNPITGTIDGNGNYTFPITDLTDGQEVKVQLTEPNNKPGLSEPGVVDKNPPSITDITSAQEPGMIVITAKTDDSTGTFVIDVDGTKYGATVDENGNITASVPSDTPITAIKIMAEDEFENSNEENVPLPTAGQIITQLRQAYAGNRRVIVDSSSKYPVFYLKLIRDGVETDLGTQTGDELGRATFTLTQRLQAGDIIEAYCEADGMRSDTVRMDIP
ncbi:MAG: hypothetical protein Q4G61_08045, partial [Tissierellia bacterium]|nr:hypothetical protein [Tissierellia bacterium]